MMWETLDECLPDCEVYPLWVWGLAQDFILWTGLCTGLGRPCVTVPMDCVCVGVYIWHEWSGLLKCM